MKSDDFTKTDVLKLLFSTIFILGVMVFFLENRVGIHKFITSDMTSLPPQKLNNKINSPFVLKLIGEGTSYETPYYIFNAKKKGPIILLEAGIHGNEMAGTYALDKLLYKLKISNGKVIILPRMNILACQEGKRFLNIDLNRVFGDIHKTKSYEYHLANEIYNLVGKEKIDYLLTLHESKYLHNPQNPVSYGQTIVYGVDSIPNYLPNWLESINRKKENDKEVFFPLYSPVPTSSTEILVEKYQLSGGFCVETWRGFSMKRRIELQTNVLLSFFDIVGIEYSMAMNTFQDSVELN